ncbi:AraC family transcriptional regulator [Caballeronia sp. LjRoot34]|uniref:helix-turn-helix domain-containing protein n=1 Tax=Caballeronia sp. LjRoot34 TaxID=3342325 RepID=UPI003ECF22FF
MSDLSDEVNRLLLAALCSRPIGSSRQRTADRHAMPHDRRLRRLAHMLLANPADKSTMGEWASYIGMSERTMSRLLLLELGMSFGRWRRQMHVILALQRMTKGDGVHAVALEPGYESASGFVTMFRKAVGKPPARYLSDRITDAAGRQSLAMPAITLPDRGGVESEHERNRLAEVHH